MRLVIQRVKEASVSIDGEKVSAIGKGLLVLVGVETGDTEEDVKWLVGKTCLLYTSPSPRDLAISRMPSSA